MQRLFQKQKHERENNENHSYKRSLSKSLSERKLSVNVLNEIDSYRDPLRAGGFFESTKNNTTISLKNNEYCVLSAEAKF